jgi:hypothetical protein
MRRDGRIFARRRRALRTSLVYFEARGELADRSHHQARYLLFDTGNRSWDIAASRRSLLHRAEIVIQPIQRFFHYWQLWRRMAGIKQDMLLVLRRSA